MEIKEKKISKVKKKFWALLHVHGAGIDVADENSWKNSLVASLYCNAAVRSVCVFGINIKFLRNENYIYFQIEFD